MRNFLEKVLSVMEMLSSFATKLFDLISALLIALCAADLFYQVLYRFIIVKFLTIPSVFTEELARYGLIWITYLAIAVCYRNGSMASVNIVYDRLKPTPKLILFYLTRVVILVFLGYCIKYGWLAVLNNLSYRSPMVGIPGAALYSAPFAGCVFMAFESLTEILSVSLGKTEPFSARVPDNIDSENGM